MDQWREKRHCNTHTNIRFVTSEPKISDLDRLPPSLVEDQEVAGFDIAATTSSQRPHTESLLAG